MILQVYSVFDSKVGAYAQPVFYRSRGEAVRSFTIACKDEKLPFMASPGDYRLWYLGDYHDDSGLLVPSPPQAVIGADEIS